LLLTGCGKKTDGSDYVFKYDLSANPHTLDPQTAVDENSLLVIMNLFDGLLRIDSAGNITAGVAMEYKVSKNLMTYTFYLRDDIFWKDRGGFQAQCTANDFVFAFRRLFNPQVKSRNAEGYFCIKNSRAVNEGKMAVNEVGVFAEDDFTLKIQLDYPDSNFPLLLTAPPSFPCNEEYYINSEGRYGKEEYTVPSNGGFYLSEWFYDPWWTEENRIFLRRHTLNCQYDPDLSETEQPVGSYERVYPRGINFYIDRENHYGNFTANNADCIIIGGDMADELIRKDYPYTASENSVWGITFNMSGVFADGNLRRAFAYSIDREAIEADFTGYRKTSAIVPDSIKIGGAFFRDLTGLPDSFPDSPENPETARSYYSKSSHLLNSLYEMPVLIVPDDELILEQIRFITQQWQEVLSFFCRIEVLNSYDYVTRLADGNYDIAAVKIIAAYNSPSALLDQLSQNVPQAAELVQSAKTAESDSEIADFYRQAETAVLQSAEFIPLCFQTQYFFFSKKSQNLMFNSFNSTIDFRNGKMF